MSEVIKAYQEINKRRQSDGMDVNSLTMFAEAWGLKQVEVDILQTKIGILQIKLNGADERAAAVLNHKNKMIDELQARVDEALNMLCKLQYSSGERIYNDVGNILKGNKDETGLN